MKFNYRSPAVCDEEKSQYGFTFIELLLSLFIMSILLFGFDAIEVKTLTQIRDAYHAKIAGNQIMNLVAELNNDDSGNVIRNWNKQNQAVLPKGYGMVSQQNLIRDVSIYWGNFPNKICNTNQLGQSGCMYLKNI